MVDLNLDELWASVIQYFGSDTKQIDHARRVCDYAKEIFNGETSNGSVIDFQVVSAAAMLHDIGIPESLRKYGNASGENQELEGPPIARKILKQMNVKEDVISVICEIIGSHHSYGEVQTKEFGVIWDSDWLVNIPDAGVSLDKAREIVDQFFMTKTGKQLAEKYIFR